MRQVACWPRSSLRQITKVPLSSACSSYGGGSGTVLRSNLARFHADGSVDMSFDPGAGTPPTDVVAALSIQGDGKILVGGRFTTLGGGGAGTAVRHNIGRLLPNGALDTTFDAGLGTAPAGTVSSIINAMAVLSTGRILIGGEAVAAPHADQLPRHLARLTRNGALDADFEPRANGTVRTIVPYAGGRVLVGGDFTTIGGSVRQRIARLQALGPASPEAPIVPAAFTDDPIVAGATMLRAVHIVELRVRINALRERFHLARVSWTDDPLTGRVARAVHVQELRDALLGAYDAALTQGVALARPLFIDSVLAPGASPVRAVHIQQLRAAVVLLETS